MMPKATINLSVQPYRMLTKADAASYCGVPVAKLEGLCPWAPVMMPDGSKRWDVRDLDKWIDGLKTGAPDGDDAILARLG